MKANKQGKENYMFIAIIGFDAESRKKLLQAFSKAFETLHIPLDHLIPFEDEREFLKQFYVDQFDLIILDFATGMEIATKIHNKDRYVHLAFYDPSENKDGVSFIETLPYIIKPFRIDEVDALVSVVKKSSIFNHLHIILPNGRKVYLKQIVYTQCYMHYIYFHMTNGEVFHTYILQKDLAKLLEPFDHFFTPISRGINVNFHNVLMKRRDGFKMIDGTNIPVPRRRWIRIRSKYDAFVAGYSI